jgi:elongation factor Ts
MAITIEQVKELRDQTGVSIMQCRKALEEAQGDMEKAAMILKKKSSEAAAKKSDREVSEGTIVVERNGNQAVAVELLCETDFVAKNDDFVTLAQALAKKAAQEGVDAMQAAAPDMISAVVQKVGENIKLGKVSTLSGDVIGSYVHDGKKGAIVVLKGGSEELAKDVAMQVTAMSPEYTKREDIPADMIEKTKEIFREEVENSGKPEDIKAKMMEGKINAYFKDLTLMDQAFFKNPDLTVAKLLAQGNAELVNYVRVSIK